MSNASVTRPKIHIHAETSIEYLSHLGDTMIETLCEQGHKGAKVVSVEEYLDWVRRGKTPHIFCGHCRNGVGEE